MGLDAVALRSKTTFERVEIKQRPDPVRSRAFYFRFRTVALVGLYSVSVTVSKASSLYSIPGIGPSRKKPSGGAMAVDRRREWGPRVRRETNKAHYQSYI